MSKRERRDRRVVPARHQPVLPVFVPDRREVARFLREQPPQAPPPRGVGYSVAGLVALPLLGYRVVRPHEV